MPRREGSGVHITTNIGVDMSEDPFTTKAYRVKNLIAVGLLLTLASLVTTIRASTTNAGAAQYPQATASNTTATCADAGDVFELDVPGTYAAFAMTSTGVLPTHVRGGHGEVLATTRASAYNTVPVDVASGAKFGIAPPQVFELASNVMIHVESQDAPYELVIVRLGKDDNEGRIDIRPPVERVLNESGSCLIGDLREYFRIRTDATYSDLNARQVFMISGSEEA